MIQANGKPPGLGRWRVPAVAAVAFTATSASCSSCELHYAWTSLGPREMSGAIRQVIVDPANSKRLYAAAENGGVWVLPNVDGSGGTWQPLSDQLKQYSITYPVTKQFPKTAMIERIEELSNVDLQDPTAPHRHRMVAADRAPIHD